MSIYLSAKLLNVPAGSRRRANPDCIDKSLPFTQGCFYCFQQLCAFPGGREESQSEVSSSFLTLQGSDVVETLTWPASHIGARGGKSLVLDGVASSRPQESQKWIPVWIWLVAHQRQKQKPRARLIVQQAEQEPCMWLTWV